MQRPQPSGLRMLLTDSEGCQLASHIRPPPSRCARHHVSQASKPYLRLSRRPKASATGGGHSSQRSSDENEVMNASEQEKPVRRGSDDKFDDPSTTPNADEECVTPKKARTDNHEDYSDATIIDSAEMHSDMEADDRPFTTVTYKKARPAGIPVIFKLTDPGASFWKVNPNKLASEVVTAAKEKVQSFRVNRDGNFSGSQVIQWKSTYNPLLDVTTVSDMAMSPNRAMDNSVARSVPERMITKTALRGIIQNVQTAMETT
ncbi:hypothetical protein HPB52_003929 [Rhipicephalus sanguineus]|uniref:Uncharacterized protein n=1 Tax=Rhipicephalus sanguineus TaxID=34632 RepID=A0A9D4QED2_RHISA|nr:hypothetical protein HPB52_003929 [Rhipicephalus sanguineus]